MEIYSVEAEPAYRNYSRNVLIVARTGEEKKNKEKKKNEEKVEKKILTKEDRV